MPWEDGKIRYVGKGTVALADGREVPVVAALVLKLDPETVPSFTHDRHTTWVENLHTDTDDDLWDAAPGLLTLPDGRVGTFMSHKRAARPRRRLRFGPAPFCPTRSGRHPNSPSPTLLPWSRRTTRSGPPINESGPCGRA